MISVNATIFVQLVLFLLLVFSLNRIMVKPILRVIRERESYIEEQQEKTASVHAEVAELAKQHRRQLRAAEGDAQWAKYQLKNAGNEQARMIEEQAHEQVVALRLQVRDGIRKDLEQAKQELQKHAESLSFDVTQKIIGRRI